MSINIDEIKLLNEQLLKKNVIPNESTPEWELKSTKEKIICKINENIDKIHKFIQHGDDDNYDEYVEPMDYDESMGVYKYTIITIKNDYYKYFDSDMMVHISASELEIILDDIVSTLNEKYSKSFDVYHNGSDFDGVYRSSMYVNWDSNKKSID